MPFLHLIGIIPDSISFKFSSHDDELTAQKNLEVTMNVQSTFL